MRLVGVELIRADVPFRVDIGTAAGVHRERAFLFVRVVSEAGEGWGECAALGEGTSVDPPIDEVDAAAETRGVPRLWSAAAARGGELPLEAEVAQLFGSSPVDRMLAAVFEMAVADAELREEGQSLATALGVGVGEGFGAMPVGAAVGIPAGHDVGVLRDEVETATAGGAARVRIKIAPDWDSVPLRAVRTAHPDLVMQADANGSYRLQDADHVRQLENLAEFDLVCIEQPLPPSDLIAHAELAKRITVPICLDESLSSPRRVIDALRNGSCGVACLKPARLGGLRAARVAHAACARAGVPAFVGGFFEAGLGRASNLALAARLAEDAPGLVGDISAPADYLDVDPCGYPAVRNGWVQVPRQPGVGLWPNQDTLENLTARRRWFPATYT
ncbi:MAG TPA: enolase C-terminal domain-like protein [Acidimicrobiales bacterium]|nr:enolase C-terminal domain-like protein [Acidimicrobiales bacterium]